MRRQQEQQRLEQVARLDNDNTHRPKSLEIEIADRKRTLSKYLNQKQVDKFIQMQNEYGRIKNEPNPKPDPRFTPQPHAQPRLTPNPHLPNEYELTRAEGERKKERTSINDSFEKFAEQQRHSLHNDYMRTDNAGRPRGSLPPHEMEYEVYHNGKGVANPQLKAA